MEEEVAERIAELLKKTEGEHKRAFREEGGRDPDWPLWYAERLVKPLGKLLGAGFTRSELVYLLVTADKERELMAPGSDRTAYLVRFFIERYL